MTALICGIELLSEDHVTRPSTVVIGTATAMVALRNAIS